MARPALLPRRHTAQPPAAKTTAALSEILNKTNRRNGQHTAGAGTLKPLPKSKPPEPYIHLEIRARIEAARANLDRAEHQARNTDTPDQDEDTTA